MGSPRLNAEVLLMFTLSCDRAYLYAHPERELTVAELDRYEEVLQERMRGMPSQYITGHQEFWGLDLIVTPAVLIPRPETEHIVEAVLALVSKEFPERNPRILDVGTGSGCIALALASELPPAEIWAIDISPAALEIARANAVRLQLAGHVRFLQSDLLENVPREQRFDLVVSNPPYVGEGEEDRVQREVRKFEPREAVFAGQDGMDVISRLIPQAQACLVEGGSLLIEIGCTQECGVRSLLLRWSDVRAVPDLQGIPRVIVARRT